VIAIILFSRRHAGLICGVYDCVCEEGRGIRSMTRAVVTSDVRDHCMLRRSRML
jgi:hypothetical protein